MILVSDDINLLLFGREMYVELVEEKKWEREKGINWKLSPKKNHQSSNA